MKASRVQLLLLTSAGVFSLASPIFAIQPTWAKKAVAFPTQCEVGSTAASSSGLRTALQAFPAPTACRPIRIPSPDKRLTVEVKYSRIEVGKGNRDNLIAYFILRARDGTSREGDFPGGFQNIDLLWSPDSKAFFVNGGNGGGYWGFWVYVYRVDDPKLEPLDITSQAKNDMAKSFPPCKASGLDRKTCLELEKDPDANVTGIDWSNESSNVVVMAEVPCSGGHGGIMCQVIGYELNQRPGVSFVKQAPEQFKQEWQKSMAFRFHVPDPPEYCEKGNPQEIPGCIGHTW